VRDDTRYSAHGHDRRRIAQKPKARPAAVMRRVSPEDSPRPTPGRLLRAWRDRRASAGAPTAGPAVARRRIGFLGLSGGSFGGCCGPAEHLHQRHQVLATCCSARLWPMSWRAGRFATKPPWRRSSISRLSCHPWWQASGYCWRSGATGYWAAASCARHPPALHDRGRRLCAGLRLRSALHPRRTAGVWPCRPDLIEAAYTDGATELEIFRLVMLPLATPVHAERNHHVLGACIRRIRGHHHLCRQPAGLHADHAACNLQRLRDQPGCRAESYRCY
jgi:hypothetical protein